MSAYAIAPYPASLPTLLFLSTGAGLIFYFRYEKERMERKRIADMSKGVGRPKVGGPFELTDQDGKPVTEADFKGKYSLVSQAVIQAIFERGQDC